MPGPYCVPDHCRLRLHSVFLSDKSTDHSVLWNIGEMTSTCCAKLRTAIMMILACHTGLKLTLSTHTNALSHTHSYRMGVTLYIMSMNVQKELLKGDRTSCCKVSGPIWLACTSDQFPSDNASEAEGA